MGRIGIAVGLLLLGRASERVEAAGERPLAVEAAPGRGIPHNAPWLSFYGTARQMGNLHAVAARFRLITIDADPDSGNFTPAEIATLRAGGRNTIVSYLNLGTCERDRSYFATAPPGFVACGANRHAQLGRNRSYPKEVWMNLGDKDYQHLILDYVAPRLASMGVSGFFVDNFEIVEHGPHHRDAPCDTTCVQGALMLVSELRKAFPGLVIVMQNATSMTTRDAVVDGVAFPSLLDGISHEEIYAPRHDAEAEAELSSWKALDLRVGGHPFSITTEDYVGSCRNTRGARRVYETSRRRGFSPYATISSANQNSVCFWPF